MQFPRLAKANELDSLEEELVQQSKGLAREAGSFSASASWLGKGTPNLALNPTMSVFSTSFTQFFILTSWNLLLHAEDSEVDSSWFQERSSADTIGRTKQPITDKSTKDAVANLHNGLKRHFIASDLKP